MVPSDLPASLLPSVVLGVGGSAIADMARARSLVCLCRGHCGRNFDAWFIRNTNITKQCPVVMWSMRFLNAGRRALNQKKSMGESFFNYVMSQAHAARRDVYLTLFCVGDRYTSGNTTRHKGNDMVLRRSTRSNVELGHVGASGQSCRLLPTFI